MRFSTCHLTFNWHFSILLRCPVRSAGPAPGSTAGRAPPAGCCACRCCPCAPPYTVPFSSPPAPHGAWRG